MQAIQIHYLGPTNTKGSRLKATAQAGSVTIPYPYEVNNEAAYRKAAEALCDKLKWAGKLGGGQLPNGDYVFTFCN